MLAPFQHQIDLKHDKPTGIHRRAFSWNGALPGGLVTGTNPIWKPKARHYPLWAAPTVSATRPERDPEAHQECEPEGPRPPRNDARRKEGPIVGMRGIRLCSLDS